MTEQTIPDDEVFPAHAKTNLDVDGRHHGVLLLRVWIVYPLRLPRACGDEPGRIGRAGNLKMCSPRHAGMNRSRSSIRIYDFHNLRILQQVERSNSDSKVF
jgi:hypothetical protein